MGLSAHAGLGHNPVLDPPDSTGKPALTTPPLILASSSPYRAELLSRLGLAFETVSPDIDETARPGESPRELVMRLARDKAAAVDRERPGALIIGSDQVAVMDGRVLGKPGNMETARAQLAAASGREVEFLTGLALLNGASGQCQLDCIPYQVHFRELTAAQIDAYLHIEQPFDCAGSFKSEGLGVALFARMQGEDPSALIGLPLIRLVEMLAAEGVDLLMRNGRG